MLKVTTALLMALSISNQTMSTEKTVNLRIIQTSDVHGCFFPYDFINRKPALGSMARISTYVKELRQQYGDKLILLDNGDILQGQPTCYYCNFVKPEMPNVAASVINYMGYDAQTIGNHDVETGHAVYDKWISEVKCGVLGANIISNADGKPYLPPYKILQRDGVRIAVLGMLTPAIPNWLNEQLWSGMHFDDIVKSAEYWVKYLKEKEHPDVIISLFHSGWKGGITTDTYSENEAFEVAKNVPGLDLVLYGHDHHSNVETVENVNGDKVLCLDPSCNALFVSDAIVSITKKDGKVINKKVEGGLKDVRNLPVDEDFMKCFKADIDSVSAFVNKKIGTFKNSIYTRDSYFGSSAFCDFIHNLQLSITGADVSFNAPLSFNTSIKAGDVHVSDLFNLYKYENQIYVLHMTGREILGHLEMSYDQWVNTMKSKDDHIMLLSSETRNNMEKFGFKNLTFNFDSAAGIDYEVDVTKPDGRKVRILRMSDGRPFDENTWYKVAMNSYRGNGGGELLVKGAGIPHDSLKSRIIYESPRDQRFYLMKEIEKAGTLAPKANNNWHFVPVDWAEPAIERDRKLIFGIN